MTELEIQAEKAVEALAKAVAEALERKRRLGQYAVVYENGRVVRIEADHRTGEVTCRIRSSRASSPEVTGAAVTFETTGTAGSVNGISSKNAASPRAASSISGEWNAPDT